jgi:TP901 family phage tail tape measure protein
MATKNLNATITIGGAITGTLKSALGTTRDDLNQIGKAISDLKSRQRELNGVVAEQEKLGRAGNALKVQYANQELGLINKQIEALRQKQRIVEETNRGMAAGRNQMASAGMALGATAAAAATAFVPVVQAAAFEKAMLGVAKQVEGTRDESGKLTQVYFDMARQVQMLGRELPMATNEIADMVAAGARMGVAKDELIGFTRTAAMMATAFELPAGELADQMGKIAGLFKIPIPNIGELADVINYLDDNAISKGGDIIEVMKRIGGTAEFVKMPAREAAALASTFLTLGSSAEVAGTAANAVMRELSIATMQPKRFQAGLEAIGMTASKVQADMSKDATGTIQRVLDALNNLPEEKRLTVATQLFGEEYGDDIAKLASGVEEYRRQLELAASDKAIGSMAREHQARLQTTTAQWEIAKNRITEVGVNIGSVLLPAVNEAMGIFGGATSAVADFTREHPILVGNIATVVGTLGGLFAATKLVAFGIGAATWAFNAMKLAMATNPIGLVLTAIAVGAVMIYKNWEPIKGFFVSLWDGIKNAAAWAWDGIKQAWLDYTPIGLVVKNWQPITEYFTGLFDNIRATATAAIDWVLGKIAAVGEMWANTKSFFGFGPDAPAPAAAAGQAGAPGQPGAPGAPGRPALPAVPPMATAKGASPVVNAPQTNNFNITQQPGQDSKQLADEVARRLAERDAVRRRGAMYDPAMGY